MFSWTTWNLQFPPRYAIILWTPGTTMYIRDIEISLASSTAAALLVFFSFSFFFNFIRRSLHLLVGCCWPAPACPLVVYSLVLYYKHRYKSQRETHARHPFYSPFRFFLCLSSEIFRTRRGAMGRQTLKASTFFLWFFFRFCFVLFRRISRVSPSAFNGEIIRIFFLTHKKTSRRDEDCSVV